MEDRVRVTHGAKREPAAAVMPAGVQEIAVEGIQVSGAELAQLEMADPRDDVLLDVRPVATPRPRTDRGLDSGEPLVQKRRDGLALRLDVRSRLQLS